MKSWVAMIEKAEGMTTPRLWANFRAAVKRFGASRTETGFDGAALQRVFVYRQVLWERTKHPSLASTTPEP